jgi:hypothetical protein
MIRLNPKSSLSLSFDMALAMRGTLEEQAAMEAAMNKDGEDGNYTEFTAEEIEARGGLKF